MNTPWPRAKEIEKPTRGERHANLVGEIEQAKYSLTQYAIMFHNIGGANSPAASELDDVIDLLERLKSELRPVIRP